MLSTKLLRLNYVFFNNRTIHVNQFLTLVLQLYSSSFIFVSNHFHLCFFLNLPQHSHRCCYIIYVILVFYFCSILFYFLYILVSDPFPFCVFSQCSSTISPLFLHHLFYSRLLLLVLSVIYSLYFRF